MDLNFCLVCGAKLRTKALPHEAAALYCGQCAEYRFPLFSAAVAAVVLDADGENMILIRQYGEIDRSHKYSVNNMCDYHSFALAS